ncbi:aECM cysteine-cradle domain-containing protein [Caenorhabditis elegans]|uniref:AECM cysteine-cradle domain-containing protein n=1 Tax=Caenorhabditis elegans TaxID=6239 RepID=Q8WSP0_CAEEL|nr:Ground-like domain-containing protein [Caenorhabditis elegans]CCD70392.1 Ground-like domain-containing protein [Caenorhabditis elegans]|eukprot:NP_741786.1 Uncharacterized protein CELE_Y34B4A.10 [Caenorhabditis elegans]
MWLSGVLLLICHYQMVSTSKTIMTNEISMPSLGHKEAVATFQRLQPTNDISTRYRSARFERLRGVPDTIQPIFVKPAEIESEESLIPTTPAAPIQVVPSSETVSEISSEFAPASNESPSALSFTEFNIESMPIIKETDSPSSFDEKSNIGLTSSSVAPTSPEVPVTTSESTTPEHAITSEAPEPISEVSKATPLEHHYAEERVYPTMGSVQAPIEFVEVLPSQQTEVASTSIAETEEPTTTAKTPKKRRHRRKHRKLKKVTKVTEAPAEVTVPTEIVTEPTTESATTPTTTTTISTTPLVTTTPPTAQSAIVIKTLPTTVAPSKVGESYLGGWNEDEAVVVTTSKPSLGYAISQFTQLPESIAIDDDKSIKAYYEKYYAEWYQKHNQAAGTPEASAATVPREIKIELAKPNTASFGSATLQPTGISSPSAAAVEPTKEQLDKVCEYVGKISKSFGIKDLVGFAKNNCPLVQSFHPASTCEQIQHLMSYCETGILVTNQ